MKPIINKKVLTRLKKGEIDKTSVMYVVVSLIVLCFILFYISSQIKYLIVVGNKFIVNGMHKTIVEKKYDFTSLEELKGCKVID
ncbi:MAG: hypothetical protein PHO23_01310 [Candidatus Pacebacteria bacterium]|nr:hypothetical protein [Candidatus Paceibacterota bacterium]